MSDLNSSRRRVLAGALAAALGAMSGCLDGSVTAGPGDSERVRVLRLAVDEVGETLRERAVVDSDETSPRWDEAAFEAVRAGDSYTVQYRKPFFSTDEDPTHAVHEGTYYRLGSVVVDEAETTRPVLRLFGVEERDAEGAGENDTEDTGESDTAVVDAETLPTGDRRAVEIAHFAARARGNVGGIPVGLVERGGYVYRNEDAVEASALLAADGPNRVSYRDTAYRLAVDRERFYEPVYRATGEVVASSPERMEAILRTHEVGPRVAEDDLSADAREVIVRATQGGYEESHPYSDAYEEVLSALHERPYLDGDIRKDAAPRLTDSEMVRYGGRYYDYRLVFKPADGDE
ncbi:hypothetical protein [Halorubrum sp. Boch-26]|uniref:hypothetical protein n=1 Tax=Halorubrum sp. Boch-26 TaxID=2994426 RepID=UPI002469112B|nr:hypothetical protein [Halorubrum sp. Boch-26]